MNPVFHASATQQPGPVPSATPLSAPTRPAQPSPVLTSAAAKSTKPALLSLKLNPTKVSGEADGHNAAPGSPSSRSKTKVHRAITEAGGQKRAIDGKDGPGSTTTNPSKRQKQSTPPGSPRGSTSPARQLVRQSRPVTDLKAMAGLSPRRTGLASPPSSPRAVTTGESAPRWRSTSHPDVPEGSRLPSPPRPARSGSLGLDQLDNGRLPHGAEPAAPAIDKADENQWDFTFSECDFGQNGELVLARQNLPAAENLLASSSAALPVSLSLSSTLIAAEILPKARVQRDAATSYLANLREQPAISSNKISSALAAAFKLEQAGLETDVMLLQMALEQNSPDDAARLLDGIKERLAELRSGLAVLTGLKSNGSASAATVAAQQALSASLDALEVACTFGFNLLRDEQAPRADNTSTANQPARQEDPVITPSNQALLAELDALDALMDEKIQPSANKSVPADPPKQ